MSSYVSKGNAHCGAPPTPTQDLLDTTIDGGGDESATVTVFMCWFHMKKACENMAKGKTKVKGEDGKMKPGSGKLTNMENWDEINEDVKALHYIACGYESAFDTMLPLFYNKWRARGEQAFVAYFENEWGKDVRRWSRCHHPPGYGSTNNGLESSNRWIKLVARHKRRYVLQFVNFMKLQMKLWSKNSKEIVKPATRAPLLREDWNAMFEYRRQREHHYGTLEIERDGLSKYMHVCEHACSAAALHVDIRGR